MAVKKFDFTKKEDGTGQGHSEPSVQAQSAVLSMMTGGVSQQFSSLPIAALDSHPKQSHYSMDENEINWLATSIAEKGVLQPIAVRSKLDGRYELLAGHRRVEGARRAGLQVVPAMVYMGLDDAGATYIFHATNLGSRSALRPSEKAYAYAEIERVLAEKKLLGARTTAAIAEETAENVRTIQRYKKLLELPDALVQKVDEDKIPLTAASTLSKLSHNTLLRLAADMDENPEQILSSALATALLDQEALCGAAALSRTQIEAVLRPKKGKKEKPEKNQFVNHSIKLNFALFARFFPATITKQEVEEKIVIALAMMETTQKINQGEQL